MQPEDPNTPPPQQSVPPQPGQPQPSFPPIAPLPSAAPPPVEFEVPAGQPEPAAPTPTAPSSAVPAPADSSPKRVGNTLPVMQDGEVTLAEIKRHPIGILTTYFAILLVLAIGAGVTFGFGPGVFGAIGIGEDQVTQVGGVVFAVLLVAAAVYGLIATKVYWGNSWVVTTDSITQLTQTSLFNRQSSQLSLPNIEDVTSEQNGVLTHIFNYGVLKVETAGEQSKFQLLYCPNPNYYAQKILAARENLHAPQH